MLATEQIAVAKALIERIDTALSWVLEAGNTSIMSDAKEIVYELLQDVSDDTILPEALRAKLKESLDQARSFIVSGDSPSSRALNCYAKLTDVQRRLLHFVYAAKHPDEPEQEIFMSNLRLWAPTTAPRELQAVLAVMAPKSLEMTQERHRLLVESKLAALARAVEPEEQDLLAELLPALQEMPVRHWARAIMYSDQMDAALAKINWDKESKGASIPAPAVKESLDEQSLQSLLEML